MNVDDILKDISREFNIPIDVVKKVYSLYWRGIRDHFSRLEIRKSMDEDSFNNLRTSVNVPNIGKFYIAFENLAKQKERFDYKYGRLRSKDDSGAD